MTNINITMFGLSRPLTEKERGQITEMNVQLQQGLQYTPHDMPYITRGCDEVEALAGIVPGLDIRIFLVVGDKPNGELDNSEYILRNGTLQIYNVRKMEDFFNDNTMAITHKLYVMLRWVLNDVGAAILSLGDKYNNEMDADIYRVSAEMIDAQHKYANGDRSEDVCTILDRGAAAQIKFIQLVSEVKPQDATIH